MKKDKPTDDSVKASSLYTPEDEAVMKGIMFKVLAQGFVPRSALVEEFGDSQATKALAILHKSYRVLVESREPWEGQEVKGVKMAERKFSQPEIKKLPPELAFLPELFKASQVRYTDYVRIVAKCRWLVPVLGALPRQTNEKTPDAILAFERNWTGKDVIIQRYGIRKMFGEALAKCNKSSYAAERFGFETITVRDPKISTDHLRGMVSERGEGLGTIGSECLAAGTEFELIAHVPTSFMTPNDYVHVLKFAGAVIGLSPGRSAGYGDFEVLGIL